MLSKNKHFILLFILITFSLASFSQSSIKLNATTLIGMPNIAYETSLGGKFTFQVDVNATFGTTSGIPFKISLLAGNVVNIFDSSARQLVASDFPTDGPFNFVNIIPELRYYTKEAGKGFYAGVHLGGSKYKFHKWNHVRDYQEGYSILVGATIGYQFVLNDNFNLELFLGGGSQSGFYKSYNSITGIRSDGKESGYNKSGEWLPYRGGLMLVYKFKKKNKEVDIE